MVIGETIIESKSTFRYLGLTSNQMNFFEKSKLPVLHLAGLMSLTKKFIVNAFPLSSLLRNVKPYTYKRREEDSREVVTCEEWQHALNKRQLS